MDAQTQIATLDAAEPIQPARPRPAIPAPLAAPSPALAGRSLLVTKLLGPLEVPDIPGRQIDLQALSEQAARYASRARGDGTRRVYRSAWKGFSAWCRSIGREPLPADPDLLSMYLV